MIASTPLGMFTLFFGWLMYGKVFDVLVQSGLVYLPFLVMIIRNVIEAIKSGADEGNPAWLALKRTEIDGLIMIIVLTLAVVPVKTLQLSQVEYVRDSCQKNDPALAKTTTYQNAFTNLNNEVAKVPVWWGLIFGISGGVTGAALESLPCSTNWGTTVYEVNSQKITGSGLQQELGQFIQDCYAPALSQAQAQGLVTDGDDVSWIGSEKLLNTPGLYDTAYAMSPMQNFNVAPDPHSAYDPVAGGGGRPNCKDWWEGAGGASGSGMNESLRERLLANVNPDVLDSARLKVVNFFGANPTDAENGILKSIIEKSDEWQVNLTKRGAIADSQFGANGIRTGAAKGMAIVGMNLDQASQAAMREGLKMMVPMLVNFVLMIIIILMPIAIVLNLYQPGLIFQISVAVFSLYFFRFLWGIAKWMEDKLWDALTNNMYSAGFVGSIVSAPVRAVTLVHDMVSGSEPVELIFAQNALYMLIIVVYFSLMAWAGFKVGDLGKAIQSASQSGANASAKGPGAVADTAVAAATGGVGAAAKTIASKI